ncbi:PP2C family protein-serine/threonine phosphatase, partial [Klebsiella pneumoniae]
GSTLVAVRLDGDEFELAWVGDSRAYRIGSEHIEQLSHDHSWVQAMVDAGQMSADEAREHPRRNVILQCLGQVGQAPEVGSLRVRLAPDELLLLCSD